jgi:hypothetical protein
MKYGLSYTDKIHFFIGTTVIDDRQMLTLCNSQKGMKMWTEVTEEGLKTWQMCKLCRRLKTR